MRWRLGILTFLLPKQKEARTEREYIEAAKDYWITRAQLERAVGGSLHPRQFAEGKSMPISNSKATR
jgi:outer membrane protein TolC